MKNFLFAFVAFLAFSGFASAQAKERVELKAGETKTVAKTKLNIKFLGISEDSRCPKGQTCVWAGNAKVNVRVWLKGKKPADIVLNSTLDPHSAEYFGYKITLISLSPRVGSDNGELSVDPEPSDDKVAPGKTAAKTEPTAVFEITKK